MPLAPQPNVAQKTRTLPGRRWPLDQKDRRKAGQPFLHRSKDSQGSGAKQRRRNHEPSLNRLLALGAVRTDEAYWTTELESFCRRINLPVILPSVIAAGHAEFLAACEMLP